MYEGKTMLCVIPARGGSKGIVNKNMRLLNGKPLIYWSINAAKESQIFDEVVVSSDSDTILKYASSLGISAIERPADLASDSSPVVLTMQHVVSNHWRSYDYVQLLQPTSPLIRSKDLEGAARFSMKRNADMVIGVSQVGTWKGIAAPLPKDLCLTGWLPKELRGINRQHVDTLYGINGCIYLAKSEIWENSIDYWEKNVYAYVMDPGVSVDIDDLHEFLYAEAMLKEREKHEKGQQSIWRRLLRMQ